jgi:hypothetical protein
MPMAYGPMVRVDPIAKDWSSFSNANQAFLLLSAMHNCNAIASPN